MDRYFGPLPREYCNYFYILAIFFGFVFVTSSISVLSVLVFHYKRVNLMSIVNSILLLVNVFLAYLANRLLHTMCVKSI